MTLFNIYSPLYIAAAYLLGSIPFGLLLSRLAGHGDIRSIGSGNIGATNVLRTGNKGLAALTLILDILKGAAAVWISFASANMYVIFACALAAVLGHMYPVWLKFSGGKGVATGLGVMGALMPPLGLAMMGLWLAAALVFRISSLAALAAFAASPALSYFWLHDTHLACLCALIAALVFWKHRLNVKRLLAKQEPKLAFRKSA